MKISNLLNKKKTFFIFFSLFITTFTIAQNKTQSQSGDFWNHVRFGGSLGLSFGDNFFSGTIAPSGIYDFNNQFALGVGLSASYSSQKNIYKSTILGASLIGLYSPIAALQFSVELEELNVDRDFDQTYIINEDENFWTTALFIGVGYRSGPVTFGIRFDVLYDRDQSIYADPWAPFVRVYF